MSSANNNSSATQGKRKKTEADNSDGLRIRNGRDSKDEEVDRIEGRGNLLKKRRKTSEGNDESVNKQLKKQRNIKDGNDSDKCGMSVKKQRTQTEEWDSADDRKKQRNIRKGNDSDECSISLKKQMTRTEEEGSADGRKKQRSVKEGSDSDEISISVKKQRTWTEEGDSAEKRFSSDAQLKGGKWKGVGPDKRIMNVLIPIEEKNGPPESSSDLPGNWKEDTGGRNVPDEHGNDSLKDWRTRMEEEKELDANDEPDNSNREETQAKSGYHSASAEEPEDEDDVPDVELRKLVKRSMKKKEKEKEKEKETGVDMSGADGKWASSLQGPHLDLMVALKQLAVVRLTSAGEQSLASCLTPASLRTVGIILEELLKDRMGSGPP